MMGIMVGQNSESFQRYPIPVLSHLSFSLVHSKGTLDITCKDEREFDFWVTGCKALLFHCKGIPVNKQVLLSHSRRFTEFLLKEEVLHATDSLYQEPETKRLEDFLINKKLTVSEFAMKLEKAQNRYDWLADKGSEFLSDSSAFLGARQREGEYVELLFAEDGLEEIVMTHQERFSGLLDICKSKLNQIGELCLENEDVLWGLEVDLENASDILHRWETSSEQSLTTKLTSWISSLI